MKDGRVLLVVCALASLLSACTKDTASLESLLPGEYVLLDDSVPVRSSRRFRKSTPDDEKRIMLLADGVMSCYNVRGTDIGLGFRELLPTNIAWRLEFDEKPFSSDAFLMVRIPIGSNGEGICDYSAIIVHVNGCLELWFQIGDPDDWAWKRFRKKGDINAAEEKH